MTFQTSTGADRLQEFLSYLGGLTLRKLALILFFLSTTPYSFGQVENKDALAELAAYPKVNGFFDHVSAAPLVLVKQ